MINFQNATVSIDLQNQVIKYQVVQSYAEKPNTCKNRDCFTVTIFTFLPL